MNRVIATPHIVCEKNMIAKTVIMPGDPNRSKFIAQNFLEKPELVNDIRGVQGYTGTYKGKRVTVMASGMGNASMGIYSYELFNFFDVEKIIRVGTCGALKEDVELGEIMIAADVWTSTNYAGMFERQEHHLHASRSLQEEATNKAKQLGFGCFAGAICCTDTFYSDEGNRQAKERGCIGVEMESAALYYNAKECGKEALTICSVSDNIVTGKALDAKARETNFKNMMILALEMA